MRYRSLSASILTAGASLLPLITFAQQTTQDTKSPIFRNIGDVANKACQVVNILFAACIILTIIFVLLAAIKYITKGSDPKAVSDAHQQLMWAAIGFAVALIAAVVPKFIGGTLGVTVDYPASC